MAAFLKGLGQVRGLGPVVGRTGHRVAGSQVWGLWRGESHLPGRGGGRGSGTARFLLASGHGETHGQIVFKFLPLLRGPGAGPGRPSPGFSREDLGPGASVWLVMGQGKWAGVWHAHEVRPFCLGIAPALGRVNLRVPSPTRCPGPGGRGWTRSGATRVPSTLEGLESA